MKNFLTKLWRACTRRASTPLQIVGARQLHHGTLYVADVDNRRLVFVLSAHAVGLLAAYEAPQTRSREEPATSAV